ncbi:hypothetical protein LPB140_12030 [Sphingorhabdus lutea]|uniref:Thioredoxin domain-containing protein n=1 Tax=Sphingorhabdus lutea TaxID=1913578 RepID=A0A1L3JFC9_9SPHN|nr:hypothetical protein LPB140_12030 [Sphingorhabdus lutea]
MPTQTPPAQSSSVKNNQSYPLQPMMQADSRAENPEVKAYDKNANAQTQVQRALDRAKLNGKYVIIAMGANWCHDSLAFAGWFETPRFKRLRDEKFEIVYVDVGTPQSDEGRNLDIVKRFKGKSVKNTPYVMIISPQGTLLNKKSARDWRNAASRSEADIYNYFLAFGNETRHRQQK